MYLNSVDGKVSWHGSQKVFSSSCDIRGLFHQLQIARPGIYNLSRLAAAGGQLRFAKLSSHQILMVSCGHGSQGRSRSGVRHNDGRARGQGLGQIEH